jgi:hypothetical protein
MLSVLVTVFNADVYGQHDYASVKAAAAPVVPDYDNILPMVFMQGPNTPDGNLPAAAWQQLCARERQLKPREGLLPPLQAQLLDTLGCNSKGFLWLAPVWKAKQPSHLGLHDVYTAMLPMTALVITGIESRLHSSSAGAKGGTSLVSEATLRQLLLLPAFMLRRELHLQQAGAQPLFPTLRAATACLQLLKVWSMCQEQNVTGADNTGKSAAAAKTAGGKPTNRQQTDSLWGPVLHEMLQLLTNLLLGVLQAAQPGGNGGSSGSSGGGKSSGASSGSNCRPAGKQGHISARTSSSPADERSQGYPKVTHAAAVTVLASIIAVLLPAATRAVMAQPAGTSAHKTAAGSTKSGLLEKPSLAATWVLLLLRLTATLEQAMRFEARAGPSQAEMEATVIFDCYNAMVRDGPYCSAAWLAAFLLMSPVGHHHYGWMSSKKQQDNELPGDWPALLLWMLDNATPEQLPAAQQRVLSLLCTAAKMCSGAQDSKQHVLVTQACSVILRTAGHVLTQLLPQREAAPGPSRGQTRSSMTQSRMAGR